MGKMKLIRVPKFMRDMIRTALKTKRPMTREGSAPYTYDEVYNYMRMYISGYTPAIIAEYYDVKPSRVYNAMTNGGFTYRRSFVKLRALNARKRKLGHKLVGVQEFFDNDLY